MTVRQRTLAFLSDPNVIAILMMLGTLGIALEFYHPGGIVPGALGAFFLLLAFLSMKVIPVNVGALVLILAGVALMVVEGYVTTHGIAGLAGAALLAIGTLFFIDRSSAEYRFDPALLTLSPWVVWPTPMALGAILGFVGWKVARTRQEKLRLGAPGMLGEVGRGHERRRPRGGRGLRPRGALGGAVGPAHRPGHGRAGPRDPGAGAPRRGRRRTATVYYPE